MILNLIKINDIAPAGRHNGTITDASIKTGTDEEGSDFNDLVLGVEIDAVDASGKKRQLVKKYNLLGRGLAGFRSDYKVWTGRKLANQDLVALDADKLLVKQPVSVEIKHRKDGKEMIAVIDRFHPVRPAVVPAK